ncbi:MULTISPECIES: KinB-signaling pathway activation protein [Bacillaceae]|uniref:KinB-signaling pathway activation protein n=1 Tax=Peribacillus simplex TaxID=1478 RepID=A0A125QSF8_9BACI|nr:MULTISPECIES: KinB-signaling pathway activation protein [Bacillaceae]KWW21612.1 KinB-signaling pathway activation protein [Peribacillus simplex]PJN86529.1 KinB-signaling pathway activation protein [Bacillus sp. mrc49]
MNSRNLVKLFFTTLLIGGITGGVVGFLARWGEFKPYFSSFEVSSILSTFIWLFGVGLIFSVISQAGFFAYLTIHRFGLGIFKSAYLWNAVQIVLILFVVFDLVYLRYLNFGAGEGISSYIVLALVVLAAAVVTAFFKMKQANGQSFIPALFFMVVFTVLEWLPVLNSNDEGWLYFMLFPLLVCNAYQLLVLSKLIERSQQELAGKRARKQAEAKGNNVKAGELGKGS